MEQRRYDLLDGLRGIAALCVMLYHFTHNSDLVVFENAQLAVDLFFILSGFVIAYTYGGRLGTDLSYMDYIRKRIIRLYPLFLLGIAAGLAILFVLYITGSTSFTPAGFALSTVLNALFLPYLSDLTISYGTTSYTDPIFPSNNPSWSLFFEMVASLSFIFLYRLSSRKTALLAATFLTAWVAYTCLRMDASGPFYLGFNVGWREENFLGGFLRVGWGFTVGILIHEWKNELAALPLIAWTKKFPAQMWLLFLGTMAVFAFPYEIKGLYALACLALILPAIVVIGSVWTCKNAAQVSICHYLGWLSFPLYCLHFPILRLCEMGFLAYAPAHVNGALQTLLATVLSLSAAILAGKYYDGPLRAHLTRRYR